MLSKQKRTVTKQLEKQLDAIENLLNATDNDEERRRLVNEKTEISSRINAIYVAKSKGAQVRARAQWVEDGEKNTKYFLGLEQKHQTNNTIVSVKDSHGHNVYEKDKILGTTSKFYEKLYGPTNIKVPDIEQYLNSVDGIEILSEDESQKCEGQITLEECEKAVFSMSGGKSPGYDGLPGEFYQCFWDDVKVLVVESFNEAFMEGCLAETQKQAVLTLIFKKGERDELKNYRPISLSNVDYKILAFALANRLQTVIHKIVPPGQTAYIKGRYIGENIRLLLDIIEYCESNLMAGVLLFLDFEKAFDSLDWNFLKTCLKHFGFEDDFCKWIGVIYNDTNAYVKVNGYISKTIKLYKGIRQGCPISALLFILCTVIMYLYLNQDVNIKGIDFELDGEISTVKCTQFADDTCIYLKNLEQVERCIECINQFSNVSGLKLNLRKTDGLCIGTLRNIKPNITYIQWPDDPIRYLGIYIGHDADKCQTLNWQNKLDKMQKLVDSWRTHHLSIIGKIMVLKMLAIPKLIYPSSLLVIPDNLIKDINKIMYNFIWGSRDKIKRCAIINVYEKGGLQMIDIESQFHALKASWIARIIKSDECIWSILPKYYLSKMAPQNIYIQMNFQNKSQMPSLNQIPTFYQEVIAGFACAKVSENIQSKSDLYNQVIWGNRFLKIKGKCLYSKSFIAAGIVYVKDVLTQGGAVDPTVYNKLADKRHYFRVMYQIKEALRPYQCFTSLNEPYDKDENIDMDIAISKSRVYYAQLVKQKAVVPKSTTKWEVEFSEEVNWQEIAKNKILKQLETKIAEFNYKVLNNILATNYNLFRWEKSPTAACIYCQGMSHDAKHLLWLCPSIQIIWQKMSVILGLDINWKIIIKGVNGQHTVNSAISLVSYIIYKKIQEEKESPGPHYQNVIQYVENQLTARLEVYKECHSKQTFIYILEKVLTEISM
jgi:hypothetical protein